MDFNIQSLPLTSNQDLSILNRPKRLSLETFNDLEVSQQETQAREMIYALEETLHAQPGSITAETQGELGMEPVHRFTNGIYTRELYIPPNRCVVGKRHAIEHIVMLTSGACMCATERGIEYMIAPMTFISPAGEKRVVMTYSDIGCTWVTIHRTDETDLDAVEKDVIISEPKREAVYASIRQNKETDMKHIEVNS